MLRMVCWCALPPFLPLRVGWAFQHAQWLLQHRMNGEQQLPALVRQACQCRAMLCS